jgi:O-antigen/teichoic acid export membrane protein
MAHIATAQQFARNLTSGWLLLVAEVAVAFLLTPYVIATLGAAQYGVWALMIGVIGYMGLVDVGIRGSVGRYINHYLALKDRSALDQVVGTSNIVLTALATLALGASLVLAAFFGQIFPKTPPELLAAVRFCLPLLALGLWISFISSILGNLLAAREALYLTNRFTLAVLVIRAGATVACLRAGWGIEGLVVVTVGTSAIGLAINGAAVRRVYAAERPRMIAFSAARLAEMWRFGVASFAGRTASTLANDSAPVIGMWVLGPEAVGIYSVAMTLAQHARRVVDQAGSAIFASVMKAGAIKDMRGLRAIFLRFMDVSFAIGSLVFIGLMVFGHGFLGLWVGPEYQAGALVAAILAFGYLMQSVASTATFTLLSLDRVNVTAVIGIGEAIACVALTAVLPGTFGIAGLALGATLPRLATNCVLYPWLAVAAMGDELRPPMAQAIARNLVRCVAVAALFGAVWAAMPTTTWPTLIGAFIVVTLLHLVLFGDRYQVSAAERVHALVHHHAKRLARWSGMRC